MPAKKTETENQETVLDDTVLLALGCTESHLKGNSMSSNTLFSSNHLWTKENVSHEAVIPHYLNFNLK